MNCTELQELAALHALGVLESSEAARLDAALAHDPDAQAEVAAIRDAVLALAQSGPPVAPPPGLRARVLAQIARTPQRPASGADTGALPVKPGFQFTRPAEQAWQPTPFPGVRMKILSLHRATGRWFVQVELAPGARFPEHDHADAEDLYVLSGDLHNEGRVLGPGDFIHAEGGTHHGELYSPGGCIALVHGEAPPEVLAEMK